MASKAKVLTQAGYAKLEAELENLKTNVRREVAEKIKVARAFGDLSENSEYDEAKNEQAEVEARIEKIESILRNAEVVSEADIDLSHVSVGTTVKVYDYQFDEEVEYAIVGSTEIDPFANKISSESPIGIALLGKSVDDEVTIAVPDGTAKLKILEIRR